MNRCKVCDGPILISIFRNEGYCCDDHRKILTGEKPPLVKETRVLSDVRIMEIDLVKEGGFPITVLN